MSREHIQQIERRNKIQKIANAIGDRRIRDVIDYLALFEQVHDWNYAVSCLAESKDMRYKSPISTWGETTRIEPLKYREMLFELFSCPGFEAIPIPLANILKLAIEAESHTEATKVVSGLIIEKAEEYLNQGEALFLCIDDQHNVPPRILNRFLKVLNDQISHVNLFYHQNLIDITNLWHTELGRRVLSDLGINGHMIDFEMLESVLSVLPVSKVLRKHIRKQISRSIHNNGVDKGITIPEYQILLNAIIKQDLEGIIKLGSKYALPTVNFITKTTLDLHKNETTPDVFRKLLKCLDCLLAIRHISSISILEEIVSLNDSRISPFSINALGHYYHESSVAALLEIICKSKNEETLKIANSSIIRIAKRLPEAIIVLDKFLESSDCRYVSRIKRLLKILNDHRY